MLESASAPSRTSSAAAPRSATRPGSRCRARRKNSAITDPENLPLNRERVVGWLVSWFRSSTRSRRFNESVASSRDSRRTVAKWCCTTSNRRSRLGPNWWNFHEVRFSTVSIIMSLPLVGDEGDRLVNARFPTVLIDTSFPGLPSVCIDDRAGGSLATQAPDRARPQAHCLCQRASTQCVRLPRRRSPRGGVPFDHGQAGLHVPASQVRYGAYLHSRGTTDGHRAPVAAGPSDGDCGSQRRPSRRLPGGPRPSWESTFPTSCRSSAMTTSIWLV